MAEAPVPPLSDKLVTEFDVNSMVMRYTRRAVAEGKWNWSSPSLQPVIKVSEIKSRPRGVIKRENAAANVEYYCAAHGGNYGKCGWPNETGKM